MKKVVLKSFGCQMNKLDSGLITSALKKNSYEFTDKISDADLVVINTCSVRQHAEERVLSNLGHLKHLRRLRPEMVVAVIGCMAQRLGDELLKHNSVDVVCGPGHISKLMELVNEATAKKSKTIAIAEKIRLNPTAIEVNALEEFELEHDLCEDQLPNQAFVRAMRGCNKFCTYCIVPYVRGPEASRPPHAIIEQIRDLASKGVKQITLLGQTINSYSYSQDSRNIVGLAELLEMTSQVDGIEWIRFITSYPADFDDRIFQVMAANPKICRYLHIPAQSGSDRILEAMNRHYTADQYLALLDKARQIVPDIAIAGDIIVGFPGETDEDFEATVNLVRKAQYKNSFIFKYSPRPGTYSEKKLEDSVPEEVKKQRNYKLLEVQNQVSEEYNKRFLGMSFRVLVESISKKAHLNNAVGNAMPQLISRTAGDYIVVFNGPAELVGNFAQVKIVRTSALTLFGEFTPNGSFA